MKFFYVFFAVAFFATNSLADITHHNKDKHLSSAHHESFFKDVSFGLQAGTLGIGPEVKYRLNSFISARFVTNYFKLSRKKEIITRNGNLAAPIDIKGDLRLFSSGLVIDVHPFENWFYISAGAFYNGNRLNVKAHHRGPLYFSRHTYNFCPLGSIEGYVDFNKISPYVGMGSQWKFTNISLFMNAGILFQGKASAKVTKLTGLAPAVTPQAIIHGEAEVEHQVNKHKLLRYYPVISLGIRIDF